MNYITKNKQSFGLVAKDYIKFRGSYNSDLYKLLFSLITNGRTEAISILDLGCGVGNSTEPIAKLGKSQKRNIALFGCDPDALMLKEARSSAKKNKLAIMYAHGSAEKLPFKKGAFDIIISGAAFHWFATKKAMREIRRVLKKDGVYFVFWTQNIKSDAPVIGHELYRKYKWKGIPQKLRDPKEIKKIFIASGFSKIKTVNIPYVETKTIPETIGLLKTNSTYALLSDQKRKGFIHAMTQEYRRVLGKKKNILKQEIHICYGIK